MTIIENYLIEAEMSDIPFPLDPNGAKHNEESFLVFFKIPHLYQTQKCLTPPPFFFYNKHPLTYTGYDCIMSFMGRQFSYYIDYPCDYYHKETNFFF